MKDSRNECQNPQVIQEILPINAWFQKSDEKQCKFLFYALQKSLKKLVLVTSRWMTDAHEFRSESTLWQTDTERVIASFLGGRKENPNPEHDFFFLSS